MQSAKPWAAACGSTTLSAVHFTRLTFESTITMPGWSSDGKRIVFAAQGAGEPGLFWTPADGSGREERLTATEGPAGASSFSPDGEHVAFENRVGAMDIWLAPLQGERKPRPFIQTAAFAESAPRFSPDGRWLAYTSTESGRPEVHVQPSPDLVASGWCLPTEALSLSGRATAVNFSTATATR